MGAFGVTESRGASVVLASSGTKATPAVSTSNQECHAMSVDAALDERIEVWKIQVGIALNTGAGGATATAARSLQNEGAAEGNRVDIGDQVYGATAVACTNDSYATKQENGSPTHRGLLGKDVTVRTFVRTSNAVNTTGMCARDGEVTGRRVRVRRRGAPFRGAF